LNQAEIWEWTSDQGTGASLTPRRPDAGVDHSGRLVTRRKTAETYAPDVADATITRGQRPRLLPRPPFTAEQWRRWTEWPVTAAAVVFLVAYSWSVIADLKGQAHEDAEWVMWSVWVVFVIDYVALLLTAQRRVHWFLHHLPQFAVVALPALRPLRLLRLLSLWNVLQRAATTWVRGRISVYVAGCAAILVYIAALAELEAERDWPGSNIKDFPTSVWWAFETITTVGYGDHFPKSPEGRAIAVGLMIAGIGVLGIVTATLASWLVERVQVEERESDAVTAAQIQQLSGQIETLTAQIALLADDHRVHQQD
jgi:voltage-gated potassium channel